MSAPGFETVATAEWRARCADALGEGYTYFDFLSATELRDGSGVELVLHVAVPGSSPIAHRLLCTQVRYDESVASIADVYAGAVWHEREAYEMFGVQFDRHPDLRPLLLEDAQLRPLRKSFTLTSRVETPWPGAEGRKRPLGVPRDGGAQ